MKKLALELHQRSPGKLEVKSKVTIKNKEDLSLAYSPGVAEPCREIAANSEKVWQYTNRGNNVAVVTDGSAVLGLGNIGAQAAMPVMEGKAVLFKEFANIDAFPLCVNTQNVDEIVRIVKGTEATWGGINLEDISSPRCIEIERRLKEETDIPIFHDDQHGTAIVATAALINSLKLVNKKIEDVRIVVNGSGAGGIATAKLLMDMNCGDLILCDSRGIIHKGRRQGMNWIKEEMAERTNQDNITGDLARAMEGADVFLGLSVPDSVTKEMVVSMNRDPIIFALANPVPEIYPHLAQEAGAKVVGTGRSDFPNQINNVLAFPGILRGALDVQAKDINEDMKIAASQAIAELIPPANLRQDYVIPDAIDKKIAKTVARAVAKAAIDSGLNRKDINSI
ncbi:NAD(P)-dependent malic enzyme [Natranaerobius thermophilus]|nr:malic enzyme-like NAD(P)-binding protein [Natranaerobius thermophilus]